MTPLLSREQAAALLGVSVDTFARRVQSEIPSVRIGRQLMYDERDIESWVAEQKAGHSDRGAKTGRSTSAFATRGPPELPGLAKAAAWGPVGFDAAEWMLERLAGGEA